MSQASLDVLVQSLEKVCNQRQQWRLSRFRFCAAINKERCQCAPTYGWNLLKTVRCMDCSFPIPPQSVSWCDQRPLGIIEAVKSYEQRSIACDIMLRNFLCYIPKVWKTLMFNTAIANLLLCLIRQIEELAVCLVCFLRDTCLTE